MSQSIIEAMNQWIRRVPGRVWLVAACLLLAAFWMQQHDARVRRQAELDQVRRQTAAEVAALKKQAAQDAERANVENQQALQKLEARRQQVDRQNRQLAAQLTELREQAQTQADAVATLPIAEVASRVAAQLGLKPEDLAASGDVVARRSPSNFAVLAIKESKASRKGAKAQRDAAEPGDHRSPLQQPGGGDTAATEPVAMALTASGARKVETALVQLNACLAESNLENRQAANCQARAAADDASIQRLDGSVASLNQAIEAKDRILEQQASEYRAELRAAKGTFFGRLARTTEHVAVGVAVGVAIGVAVR